VLGACSQCHNGSIATGRGANHFILSGQECNACHGTFAWRPIQGYMHGPGYPGDHWFGMLGQCLRCHRQNNAVIAFQFPYPFCAACHADDFDAGAHDGDVAANANCGGSDCHSVSGTAFEGD
jgi:hypothetical protein